jgi:hypothetical protein
MSPVVFFPFFLSRTVSEVQTSAIGFSSSLPRISHRSFYAGGRCIARFSLKSMGCQVVSTEKNKKFFLFGIERLFGFLFVLADQV